MINHRATVRRNILKFKDLVDFLSRSQNRGKKVDLIGVVVEFSIPRHSKGTDCCVNLKLIDETQQSPELGVTIFLPTLDELPHIRAQKDIIILSRVWIEQHDQQSCAVFNKKFSSFALYDGANINSFANYQASSSFVPLHYDEGIIRQLRDWCSSFPFDAGISDYVLPLKDVKKANFDLVCKVQYVCEVSANKWMLFVWDGTDAPMLSLNMKVTDEEQNPLPLHIEHIILPTNVLRQHFSGVGTVLRIVADEAYENLGVHFQSTGSWVRIRNIWCEPHSSGLWVGSLTTRSKFRLLSQNDLSVKERLRNYEERLKRTRVPSSSTNISEFRTVTDYKTPGCATLMDLHSLLQHEKANCIVRAIAVLPSQGKDFRSPEGEYRLRITLEDPTARVHAWLYGNDGELFFGGHPACTMYKLLGVPEGEDAPRNPPWIKCCICVHPPDEGSDQDSWHFGICETRIV